ncbi:hypothetical protein [Paracoccus methylarcula]|nr:hypothetical protein [Paracoccus methylarcula]
MRSIFIAAIMLLSAGAAMAEETPICFGKTFDTQHMQAHPLQTVRDIRARMLILRDDRSDEPSYGYDIRVLFRDDPREFRSLPGCWESSDGLTCQVDCDGGSVKPRMTGDGRLKLTIYHLRTETTERLPDDEGGCTGPVTRNIVNETDPEGNAESVFVLFPRDNRECLWEDFEPKTELP